MPKNTYQHFELRLEPREELGLMVTLVAGLFSTGLYSDLDPESVVADAQKILDALRERTESRVQSNPESYRGSVDELPK
jgi:hypothetical protein